MRSGAHGWYIRLAGNRASAMGIGLLSSAYLLPSDIDSSWPLLISRLVLGAAGGMMLGLTKFGRETLNNYRRALVHIDKHGRLDSLHVKSVIDASENEACFGYCQLQGVYLAAKERGELDAFAAAKSKYSRSLLPYF